MNSEEIKQEIEALLPLIEKMPPEDRLKLLKELNVLVRKANDLTDKLVS